MVQFTTLICGFFALLMLQNARFPVNGCLTCNIESLTKFVNSTLSKIHANSYKKKKLISLSITRSVSVKTKLEVPDGCPETVKTAEDLISLFGAKDALDGLTAAQKKSTVELLISYYGSFTVPLQPIVLLNLVATLTASPTLLRELPEPYVKSALTTITVDQRTLLAVPRQELVQFFGRLVSMPLHRLAYCVPPNAFVAIVGAVSPGAFDEMPVHDAVNLITAITLSRSRFERLPPSFTASLLKYVSVRPVMQNLPPSTLFAFLEGLFEALNDPSSYSLADAVPAATLAAVVGPVVTQRMLSVFPVRCFDLLLAVLGSCPAVTQSLPAAKLKTLFVVLTSSPRLLASVNPTYLGAVLVTVSSSKNLANGVPASAWENLMESIYRFLPECLAYVHCQGPSLQEPKL